MVLSLSRRTPAGVTLSWRLMQMEGHDFGPLLPIFIEWRTEEHPIRQSPTGCELTSLSIRSPEADALRSHLGVVGLTQDVRESDEPELQAKISSPSGELTLS